MDTGPERDIEDLAAAPRDLEVTASEHRERSSHSVVSNVKCRNLRELAAWKSFLSLLSDSSGHRR